MVKRDIGYKEKMEKDAERKSLYIYNGSRFIIFILLIFLSILTVPTVLKKWQIIEPVAWLVSILFAVLVYLYGIKISPAGIRTRFKNWLFNYIYRNKMKKSGLDNLP